MRKSGSIAVDRRTTILYIDENSLNRKLAEIVLDELGIGCICAGNIPEAISLGSKRGVDVALFDISTAQADPEGFALADMDPRFRELPRIAVGPEGSRPETVGASELVATPLEAERLASALKQARPGFSGGRTRDAAIRSDLLSRIGGRFDRAAEVLELFIAEYRDAGAGMKTALQDGNQESISTILRSLRSAASDIGAGDLYRIVTEAGDAGVYDANLVARVQEELELTLSVARRMALEFGGETATGPRGGSSLFDLAPDDSAGRGSGRARENEKAPQLPLILAVDDSRTNLRFLEQSLSDDYRLITASGGPEALALAHGGETPELMLLDVTMDGMDGYELCRRLKEDPRTRNVPVIFLTSLSALKDEQEGFALGAVDYIRKPFSVPILKARTRTHIELYRHQRFLEAMVDEHNRKLQDTQREVVYRLARAAEYRDNDTGTHIKRIGYYAVTIAEGLGFPRTELDILFLASWMHDVGKLGIPDHILLKPGKLDPEEWDIMKTHTTIGAEMLEGHQSKLLKTATRIALSHHEKWDGSGYPVGLAGEDIPIEGRIVAICDVFDALLAERPYKRAWPLDRTLDEINSLSERSFDPFLVKRFNDCFEDLAAIKENLPD